MPTHLSSGISTFVTIVIAISITAIHNRHHHHIFCSAVEYGSIIAFQFHPEKSGACGIGIIQRFLQKCSNVSMPSPFQLKAPSPSPSQPVSGNTSLSKRIIACLDVRCMDNGQLTVTKGNQYDCRESGTGQIRDCGHPVDLAERYYEEGMARWRWTVCVCVLPAILNDSMDLYVTGADEIVFLNITGFRSNPGDDAPMEKVLQQASRRVFVPLTIGGGIRDFTDKTGKSWTSLDIATHYFRSGADKVSLGRKPCVCVCVYSLEPSAVL